MAVRTAMEHPIGALPRTPFPASRDFPSRGNERYEGKNSESYTSRTISEFSLFGGCRHHLARWEACHMTQKVNPVTLTLSSAAKPPQQPSRRRRVKLKNLKNPRAGGPSTFPFTALLNNPRRKPHPLSCPLRREISPLRFASVEMTRGALANIVISSGGMRRYGC